MKLASFKSNYQVGIRPRISKCSHVDNIFIKAFSVDDAIDRVQKLLKDGAHIPELGKRIDYIVKDVIEPGHEIYGLEEFCCDRPTAYIGSSYIV